MVQKKYSGIGIKPKTWQGWIYFLIAIALIVFIWWQPLWDWSDQVRNAITIILIVVVVLDTIHIMYLLNKNEGNE